MVGNTDPVSLTDAELAAEVARDAGEVLLAVTHPGRLPSGGKARENRPGPGVAHHWSSNAPNATADLVGGHEKEHARVAREWRRARLRANPGEQ